MLVAASRNRAGRRSARVERAVESALRRDRRPGGVRAADRLDRRSHQPRRRTDQPARQRHDRGGAGREAGRGLPSSLSRSRRLPARPPRRPRTSSSRSTPSRARQPGPAIRSSSAGPCTICRATQPRSRPRFPSRTVYQRAEPNLHDAVNQVWFGAATALAWRVLIRAPALETELVSRLSPCSTRRLRLSAATWRTSPARIKAAWICLAWIIQALANGQPALHLQCLGRRRIALRRAKGNHDPRDRGPAPVFACARRLRPRCGMADRRSAVIDLRQQAHSISGFRVGSRRT